MLGLVLLEVHNTHHMLQVRGHQRKQTAVMVLFQGVLTVRHCPCTLTMPAPQQFITLNALYIAVWYGCLLE